MIATLLLLALVVSVPPAMAQASQPASQPGTPAHTERALLHNLYAYLNMSGAKAAAFRPLTQRERNSLFGNSLINPLWYLKGGLSAAQNQWNDTPQEWEQGASGYGRRYADIMGQYAVRKTVTYGLESWFQEDNRYFPSGKKGFGARAGYGLASGIMARHDNGKRYPSASLLIGYASGAYLSRFWQPPSARSTGDAAVSFGISVGWNIAFGVLKEYLPDLLRPLVRKSEPRGATVPPKSAIVVVPAPRGRSSSPKDDGDGSGQP
jgi:hypothetical protein